MGDGGRTVFVPQTNATKTVTLRAQIPINCYPTGVTYACNKPLGRQTNVPNANCKPCQNHWTTKVGNFFRSIGRGIYNCTAGLFKGMGSLFCGALNLTGGLMHGIGKTLYNFGNAMKSVPIYNPGYNNFNTFSAYNPCMTMSSPLNNGFMSGMLFGSLMNNHHHHCHRPLIYTRPLLYSRPIRPYCRPCLW